MRLVSLNLPVELIAAISRAARDAGKTPQDLLRATLAHVFGAGGAAQGEAGCAAWQGAARGDSVLPKPAQSEQQAPATEAPQAMSCGAPPLAVHLAFTEALGWLDLQSRLRAAGFVLRLGTDGVLALHSWPADHRLIDSAAIGQPLAELTLRFRAAFPGQVLAEGAAPAAGAERRVPAPPYRTGRAA
ncbi:hypothetical protein GVY41_18135 [Frigidibacter albus]|uniref:Ribbon-helix-helix protein, CopG family n=1 Tax=Frigidibacter albus TaxID=1465486 RepID=A0A6L8VPF7_9RHOB|nr:hypothetical protein [Frigidibacter albus]MZQ91040.1 hypothetical protein [Frigidibacter albus]NBE32925.1 hypothetical protein [Frigidibacter albus]GGH62124.1 hypothetical protein GCM10011341_36000 [Frigidibacter albus]